MNSARSRPGLPSVPVVLAIQLALLIWAGWRNRDNLNPDAIAYLRLASYYAHGQTELMVSGYWGPLLSWLAAAFLKLGCAPWLAGRLVMALSAVVFSLGSLALLRSLALPAGAVLAGFILAAGASVVWSVKCISPDLLVAGLMVLAMGRMASPSWLAHRKSAALAGLLWGLAYLAKAVALPLALGISASLAGLWLLSQPTAGQAIRRQFAASSLVFLLVAAPWIGILSVKYGGLTFSTSAHIAHAVAGPPDVERYHPTMRTFHRPEAGRLTSWEEPSRMPYRFWSPLASRAYFQHQLQLIGHNLRTVLSIFAGFDRLHLGLVAVLGGAVVFLWRRRQLVQDRWCWMAAPLLCLAAIYLPVHVQAVDDRYFYGAYPLLFGGAAGLLNWMLRRIAFVGSLASPGIGPPPCPAKDAPAPSERSISASAPPAAQPLRLVGRAIWVLLAGSFAIPVILGLVVALQGVPNPASAWAHDLAARLRRADLAGPVAGSGLVAGGRAGLYAAYLLNQPWYGDELNPTVEGYQGSGAKLVIVNRRQPVAKELAQSTVFRNLDARLFASPEAAEQCPLQVYQLIRP
jgi:hypothetical protein